MSGPSGVAPRIICLVPWALLLGTSAARAQTDEPGRFHLGPFYLTPKLELRSGTDTNVFNDPVDPVSDSVTVLRTSLEGTVPVRDRLTFSGSGYLDFNYFHRQNSERSTDFYGDARAELRVSSATLFGEVGGGQFRQRFSIEIDQRLLRQERWGRAGLELALGERLRAEAYVRGRQLEVEGTAGRGASLKPGLDRNELTAAGELSYAIATFTDLTGTVEVIEDRFPSRHEGSDPSTGATIASSRRVRSYRLMLGADFAEDAVVTGRVLAGMRVFPSGTGAGAAFYQREPVVTASLSGTLADIAILTAGAGRDVHYSTFITSTNDLSFYNAYVSTQLNAGATVRLPFNTIGAVASTFERAAYLYPFDVASQPAHRVDHRWTTTVSLLYQVREHLRIGGSVGYARRVSNLSANSYDGYRYGLLAEMAP